MKMRCNKMKLGSNKSCTEYHQYKVRSDFANEEIRDHFSTRYPDSVIKCRYVECRREGIQETKRKHEWDPS